MGYTPCGLQIPGPIITPDRYGLLTVAEPVTPEDGHWEGGVTWDDNLCSDIHSTSEYCPIPVTGSTPKITDSDFQFCCADAFTVYASFDCPPIGRKVSDAFSIAKKRLEIKEGRGVERVFWTGISEDGAPVNPSLAYGNSECNGPPIDLTPAAGPLGPGAALAVLEDNLSECVPGLGVIHGSYGLANFLALNHLIYPKDDAWFTVTGQRLALGAGYPGSGPANIPSEPGASWVFATGPIIILRSEIFLTPERFKDAMDTKINSVQVFAERKYAVGWSCCLFGIQVRLCADR